MFRENIFVLQSEPFLLTSTGAAIGKINIPEKCMVRQAWVELASASAAAPRIQLNSYDGTTTGDADVGDITVPAGTAALAAVWDEAGEGLVLEKHSQVLIEVQTAGDNAEYGKVGLVLEYLPENSDNGVAVMVESA